MIYLKLALNIASFILPCCGFVLFLFNAQTRINELEEILEAHGGHDVHNGMLYLTGTLSHDIMRTKEERTQLRIESALVIAGAICGLIALFL